MYYVQILFSIRIGVTYCLQFYSNVIIQKNFLVISVNVLGELREVIVDWREI